MLDSGKTAVKYVHIHIQSLMTTIIQLYNYYFLASSVFAILLVYLGTILYISEGVYWLSSY